MELKIILCGMDVNKAPNSIAAELYSTLAKLVHHPTDSVS